MKKPQQTNHGIELDRRCGCESVVERYHPEGVVSRIHKGDPSGDFMVIRIAPGRGWKAFRKVISALGVSETVKIIQ